MSPLRWLLLGLALLAAAQALAWGVLVRMRPAQVGNLEVFQAVTPGEFAGTLMLGGFRGLACDLLWLRADLAKENGRLYESLALCQTITRVQPRFEQPWKYLSWDLGYNLSHEVEAREAKWAWVAAGISTNVQGCRRNPQSEGLLRHLAWMLHHKGELFREEIEAHDWQPLFAPLLEQVNAQAGREQAVPVPARGPGRSNFFWAATLYRAAIVLREEVLGQQVPSITRTLVCHGLDRDGDLQRNRGRHLEALRRWLTALAAWQQVATWAYAPALTEADALQRGFGRESYEHNEGALRRKVAAAVRLLAPDPATGEDAAQAVMERRLAEVEALLARPGWRESAGGRRLRWLDDA